MNAWIRRTFGAACLVGGGFMAFTNGGNQNLLIGGVIIAAFGVLMLTLEDPR